MFKNKKVAVFQPSGDASRIIPCEANHAYISDQFGKTKHLNINSDEFATICNSVNKFFDGKIIKELTVLGWSEVISRMKQLEVETLENA